MALVPETDIILGVISSVLSDFFKRMNDVGTMNTEWEKFGMEWMKGGLTEK